jgi:hypothetical protein
VRQASDGAERPVRWRNLFEMSPPKITREPEQIVVLLGEAPGVAAELDALTAAESWTAVDGSPDEFTSPSVERLLARRGHLCG